MIENLPDELYQLYMFSLIICLGLTLTINIILCMLTCVSNFTTFICLSMFTEKDDTIINNEHSKDF